MLAIGAARFYEPARRTSCDSDLLFVLLATTLMPMLALITVIAIVLLFSISD